jgi:hypothetical protein
VPDTHGKACEIDHLISRELGGSDLSLYTKSSARDKRQSHRSTKKTAWGTCSAPSPERSRSAVHPHARGEHLSPDCVNAASRLLDQGAMNRLFEPDIVFDRLGARNIARQLDRPVDLPLTAGESA